MTQKKKVVEEEEEVVEAEEVAEAEEEEAEVEDHFHPRLIIRNRSNPPISSAGLAGRRGTVLQRVPPKLFTSQNLRSMQKSFSQPLQISILEAKTMKKNFHF